MFPAEICAAKLPEMVVGSLRGWNKAILLFSLLIAGWGILADWPILRSNGMS
jgi:hypothetical protein